MRELIFIIFFFSGLFKSILNFYQINSVIDITLLSSVLTLLYILYDVSRNHFRIRINKNILFSILSLLIFLFIMIVSLTYSKSPNYKYKKTILFTLNILAFIYPLLIKDFNVKRFLKLNIIITLVLSFWYMWIYTQADSINRDSIQFDIYASFYLSSSLMLGLNLIILITSPKKLFKNNTQKAIILTLFISMILTRGRGALIFSILIITLYYLHKFAISKKLIIKINDIIRNIRFVFYSIIVLLIIYIPNFSTFNKMFLNTIARLSLLIPSHSMSSITGYGNSVTTRVSQIKESLELVLDNTINFFFGYGIGSYSIITTNIDGRLYPHNIFLEIMVEMGLIGLVSFLIFGFITQNSIRLKNKFISFYVILYLLLNMMKSSSIIDIRIFFSIFAIYVLHQSTQTIIKNEN